MYHEKQSRALCAVHALNNLFQDKTAFTKKDLDDICLTLSPNSKWLNPHRSVLGIGDYDVNVVMAALQTKDCDAIWFDKRKRIHNVDCSKVLGFILNIPSSMRLGSLQIPIQRKHWITVLKLNTTYYNLDSKNDKPQQIGDEDELKLYIHDQLSTGQSELLIVIQANADKDSIWLCSNKDNSEEKG